MFVIRNRFITNIEWKYKKKRESEKSITDRVYGEYIKAKYAWIVEMCMWMDTQNDMIYVWQ